MTPKEAEIFVGLLERITAIVGIIGDFTPEEMEVLGKAKGAIEDEAAALKAELTPQQLIAVDRIAFVQALRLNIDEAKAAAETEEVEPTAETEAAST